MSKNVLTLVKLAANPHVVLALRWIAEQVLTLGVVQSICPTEGLL